MGTYIDRSDITDNIIKNADIDDYIRETDKKIISVAERLGVDSDNIETSPLHTEIKRLAVVYCLKRFCQDRIGTNNPEVMEADKYTLKYSIYAKEYDSLIPSISYEMFTSTNLNIRDRATVSGTIYRG